MNYHNLANASIGNTLSVRVGDIDVDQLLHDLGEASASSSPIELFRLCLSAQSVPVQAGAGAHIKPAETRMDSMSHGSAGSVAAHLTIRLTDADYDAIVKRYEDAGDVQNADIIRKQWEVARQTSANVRQAERGPDPQD